MSMNYDELVKNFGIKLKYYRNMRNMTQEQLSEKIGADVRYISDIERGKRNITFKTLSKFSETLSVEVKSLFNFSD